MADIIAGKAPPLTDTSPYADTTVLSPGPVLVTEGSSANIGGPDFPDGLRDKFSGRVEKLVRRIKHGSKQKPKEKPEVQLIEECTKDEGDKSRVFYDDSTGSESDGIETQTNIAYSDSPDVWEWRGPESMPDDTYDFNHFRRGIAVLIVNTEFSNVNDNRPHAERDIENLTAIFEVLGFEIKLLKNRTTRDLMDSLTDIRSKLEKDSDCFACLISTHGGEAPVKGYDNLREHVLFTHDGAIPTDDVIRTFNDSNCAAMRGKPKLFFIQACRSRFRAADDADMVDPGVDIDIITDQPLVTCPGGEGHYVSQHQGGQKEQGNHGRYFNTTTAPESLTTQDNLEMSVDRIQITGEKHEVLAGVDSRSITKADAKGRIDDNPTRMYGIGEIPFADDEKEQDDANEEKRKRIIQEACLQYHERLQRDQEQKRRERFLVLQHKREMKDADYCSIPCYSHCLIMFSSAPERLAWRDDHIGGWLPYCMYNVVHVLHRYDFRTELLQVLTEVNHTMSVYLKANTPSKPEWHEAKSTPCIYHMLTKDIYFRLKWNRKVQLVTEV